MPNLFRLPVFESSTDEDGWKTRNGEKHVFVNAEGIAKIEIVSGFDSEDNGFRITYKKSTDTNDVSLPQSELYRLKQIIKEANRRPLSMPIFDLENYGNAFLINKPPLLTIKNIESSIISAEGGGGTNPAGENDLGGK